MSTLWSDIQKGMAEAVSFTAKKTTEFTGMAKLKYSIHSEETRLSKCFEEIGRLFYRAEREGSDLTAEIAALIMQADKINSDISALRVELNKLNKSRVCDKCDSEVSDECTFCPVCGNKFDAFEADTEAEAQDTEDTAYSPSEDNTDDTEA